MKNFIILILLFLVTIMGLELAGFRWAKAKSRGQAWLISLRAPEQGEDYNSMDAWAKRACLSRLARGVTMNEHTNWRLEAKGALQGISSQGLVNAVGKVSDWVPTFSDTTIFKWDCSDGQVVMTAQWTTGHGLNIKSLTFNK